MADQQDIQANETKIQVLSELVNRYKMLSSLGSQYAGDRDIYDALGYPKDLENYEYTSRYLRQDVAAAIIDRPVDATWRGTFHLVDEDNPELDELYQVLEKDLGIKGKLSRADKLSSLGEYGIILLGFDDVSNRMDFEKQVAPGARKLLYLKPLRQDSATITKSVSDTKDPRYGLPEYYTVNLSYGNVEDQSMRVHHSRVIHITGELLEDEVYGIPRLMKVYNRLMDLEKLVGGSAEMFWRNARPGYQGVMDEDFEMDDAQEDNIKSQIQEYEHDLRRMLVNQGVKFETLTQPVHDPSKHVDVQIQMISAATGIPKRILTGTERSEANSAEDKNNWLELIQSRREEYSEIQIVRPLIDRLIKYKVLPEPKSEGYSVQWPDLFAVSEQSKANVGKTRSEALKQYGDSPAALEIIPPKSFLKYFLGFTDEQAEEIEQQMMDGMDEENRFNIENPEEEGEE